MKLPSKKQLKEFADWGVEAPSHDEHGEDSFAHPASEKLIQANCRNWKLEGNNLHCDSDFGPLRQTIPTNYILLGEKDGLPILKQLV